MILGGFVNIFKSVCVSASLRIVSAGLFVGVMSSSAADEVWKKIQPGPVVDVSSEAGWHDTGYLGAPRVIFDEVSRKYFMFYTGCLNQDQRNRERAALATSSGIAGPWTKFAATNELHGLFAPASKDAFDYDRAWGMGAILKEGRNSWKMWYAGDSDPARAHTARIGYATSTNGFDWVKVHGSKSGGSILEDGAITLSVVVEKGVYHGWYSSYPNAGNKYATSSNGTEWTLHGSLKVTEGLPMQAALIVTKFNGLYYGVASRADYSALDIYVSTNKTHWRQLADCSFTRPAQGWDSKNLYDGFLFADSATNLYLFYSADDGDPGNANEAIGCARACRPLVEAGTIGR